MAWYARVTWCLTLARAADDLLRFTASQPRVTGLREMRLQALEACGSAAPHWLLETRKTRDFHTTPTLSASSK
jgi:hypothetical protein